MGRINRAHICVGGLSSYVCNICMEWITVVHSRCDHGATAGHLALFHTGLTHAMTITDFCMTDWFIVWHTNLKYDSLLYDTLFTRIARMTSHYRFLFEETTRVYFIGLLSKTCINDVASVASIQTWTYKNGNNISGLSRLIHLLISFKIR